MLNIEAYAVKQFCDTVGVKAEIFYGPDNNLPEDVWAVTFTYVCGWLIGNGGHMFQDHKTVFFTHGDAAMTYALYLALKDKK